MTKLARITKFLPEKRHWRPSICGQTGGAGQLVPAGQAANAEPHVPFLSTLLSDPECLVYPASESTGVCEVIVVRGGPRISPTRVNLYGLVTYMAPHPIPQVLWSLLLRSGAGDRRFLKLIAAWPPPTPEFMIRKSTAVAVIHAAVLCPQRRMALKMPPHWGGALSC